MYKNIIKEILEDTSRKMNEKFIQKTIMYNSIIEFKNNYNFEGYTFGEVFYHYINKLEPIKCAKDDCSNKPTYESIFRGYRKYCSSICRANDKDMIDKVKATNLKKYGVENPFQSEEIKIKIKETNIKKYGVDNPSKNRSIINKTNNTKNNIFIEKYDHLKIISDNGEYLKIFCDKCNQEYDIYKKTFFSRNYYGYTLCTMCNPINSRTSTRESMVADFIKSNYNGRIILQDKEILGRKHLDIYLPDLNLAFEYNGLWFHSEYKVDECYHLEKTNNCLKKGIKLILIWDDLFLNKTDIIKSRILNLLGLSNKIWARKCVIKETPSKEARKFLLFNHLQGIVNCKYHVGLYYENELVSLMSFSSPRKNLNHKTEEDVYELVRFCNKLNTTIVGGASKLFNFFVKKYNPKKIVSLADRSWSNGNMYKKLNFNFVHYTDPNYYFIVNNVRENRFKYRKDILIKQGFDKEKTANQIMLERKLYKLYDSGSIKFEWINENYN